MSQEIQCPELLRLLSPGNDGAVCEKVDCKHNVFFTKLGFKRIDTEKSRSIKNCLCALTDGDRFTLEEIAEMYGVTRERIRQIEEKAIQKLRGVVLADPKGKLILDGFISSREREEGMRLYKEQKERDAKKREGMNKPKNGHVRKKRKSRAGRACRDGYGEHLHGCSLLPDSHRGGRRWAKRNLAARNTSR